MKGSVSSVMCLEKVKSMVVPLSVVDLLTSDAQSRLNMSFMKFIEIIATLDNYFDRLVKPFIFYS